MLPRVHLLPMIILPQSGVFAPYFFLGLFDQQAWAQPVKA